MSEEWYPHGKVDPLAGAAERARRGVLERTENEAEIQRDRADRAESLLEASRQREFEKDHAIDSLRRRVEWLESQLNEIADAARGAVVRSVSMSADRPLREGS